MPSAEETSGILWKKAGLVSFALSESERAYNERFDQPGFVGHPAGQEWFCEKHYPTAKQYEHLTSQEAFPLIRKRHRFEVRNLLGRLRRRL